MAEGLAELERANAVVRGPLVFLATDPVCVGHILPAHFNCSLGHRVNGDVLLATAFTTEPRAVLANLQVFSRRDSLTWQPVSLPRGICLGNDIPARRIELPPPLAAVAYPAVGGHAYCVERTLPRARRACR